MICTRKKTESKDEQQSGAEDGGNTPTAVVANLMRKDSLPDGRKPGLGAGYPITTPHTRDPVSCKRKVQTILAGKSAKPWWESMVGLVGWWRRVEQELSREENNTRRVETKALNTARERKLKAESKLKFLRKFYPECTTSPGGKTLKLTHTHKNSELLDHPSDIVRKSRLEELSFSPQAKRKAGEGGTLTGVYSPSKRVKFINNFNFFENDGRNDLAKPSSRLSESTDMETTELVAKYET